MLTDSFIVAEEEKLIPQDRSPKRSAKNILRIRVLLIAIVVVLPSSGIKLLIGQKVVEGAMPVVGAGLQDGDHLSAVSISIGGIRIP